MAGDIKLKYVTSATPTVTNLQSLPSSSDWTAGWINSSVCNTTSSYMDYMYGFKFQTASTNRQAGQINIYVIAALNDTPTWPAVATGSIGNETTISFTDTEERDALCRPLGSITVDNTSSAVYTFPPTGIAQLFGGSVPPYHCVYVSQNCTTSNSAGFSTAASAVYYTPVLNQYT